MSTLNQEHLGLQSSSFCGIKSCHRSLQISTLIYVNIYPPKRSHFSFIKPPLSHHDRQLRTYNPYGSFIPSLTIDGLCINCLTSSHRGGTTTSSVCLSRFESDLSGTVVRLFYSFRRRIMFPPKEHVGQGIGPLARAINGFITSFAFWFAKYQPS
jgi:hypothetical protein